jgi:hypothetical protein
MPAPNVLERPSANQTEYFSTGATFGKKKKPQKTQKKKQNSETLNPKSVKSFSMTRCTEKTGGLQHLQMIAPTCLGDTDKQDWMLKE